MLYFWIAIIGLLIFYICIKNNNKEIFIFKNKYCSKCNYNNRKKCSKCINCGYCHTIYGTRECIPGDSKGPYFREDCIFWEYLNPRYWMNYYYIFPFYYPYYSNIYWNRRNKNWNNRRYYRKKNRNKN